MDHESINSVFALLDCFGAKLYELLIAGLKDPCYQPDAYESFAEVLVNRGKGEFISGEQRKKRQLLRGTRQNWGTGNIRKQILREQRNNPIYFRGAREQLPPPPEWALHITEAT